MKKMCSISMYHMYITVTFKHYLCIVKLSFGMVLDAEEINREIGMFEARCSQRHVAGILGGPQSSIARMWERFEPHGNVRYSHSGDCERVKTQYEDRLLLCHPRVNQCFYRDTAL